MKKISIISLIGILTLSCQNEPKVIQATTNTSTTIDFTPTVPIDPPARKNTFQEQVHRVRVLEILDAEPYNYLRVNEGSESYWIAIRKQAIGIGSEYFFANGLLKTGFESKTHNRTFDKLYLVSKLVPVNHSNNASNQLTIPTKDPSKPTSSNQNNPSVEGIVSIKPLIENPKSYEGQHITIQGTITKINPEIMNRNWIHIQDGTADDYDLVVTSSEQFTVGQQVTLSAHVMLNKDFGAGYSYPLILENAKAIK